MSIGGKIDVESEVDKGTVFKLTLADSAVDGGAEGSKDAGLGVVDSN